MENHENLSPLELLVQAALMRSAFIDEENASKNNSNNNDQPNNSKSVPKKRKIFECDETDNQQQKNSANNHYEPIPSASGYMSTGASDYSSMNSSPDHESKSPTNLSEQFFTMGIDSAVSLPQPVFASPSTVEKPYFTRSSKKKPVQTKEKISLEKITIKPKLNLARALNEDSAKEETKIEVRTGDNVCVLSSAIGKRRPPTKTPDHLKDEDYYIRRERNNLAAKRSRENRNKAIETTNALAVHYTNENLVQDAQIGRLLMALNYVVRKMKEDSDLETAIINVIEENNLDEVAKAIYFLKNNQNLIPGEDDSEDD